MKIKILFLFTFLTTLNSFSQPQEEWVQRYNGPGNSFDIVSKLIIGNNNNLFVYGNSSGKGSLYDFVIINYDLSGSMKWTQTYNGAGNSTDQINSACIDSGNNSYVTGFTTNSNLKIIFTTAKYDSSGNLIWMKEFDLETVSNGFGQDIAIDYSGNVYVLGALRYTSTGNYTPAILKYSAEGNLINAVILDQTATNNAVPVRLIINTYEVVIACTIETPSHKKDMLIRCYDPFPFVSWQRIFNGASDEDDEVTDMILDEYGNTYVCGIIRNTSYPDYFFAKIDRFGIPLYHKSFDGPGNNSDIPYSITTDASGNAYVTGYSKGDSLPGSEDILTIKISPSGSILWNQIYNGSGNGIDQGISITTDNKGNVYVGGGSDRGNVNLIYALLKYNAGGNLQWTKNYSASNISEDFIYDVKLDEDDNIYVTGISIGIGSAFDFATVKYSQSVGINSNQEISPAEFTLYQNYPNPFNPETVIRYSLFENRFISLKVFDVLGNEVATLVSMKQNRGNYIYQFSTANYQLSSGVYYYKLESEGKVMTKKMLLLK